MKKRLGVICLVMVLLVASLASAEGRIPQSLEYLAKQLEAPADLLLQQGENIEDIYSELGSQPGLRAFPERFDLREHGLVTPVKSQNPWGTCWSFGTMAACESSLLTLLGLTAEEYEAKYGKPIDLSERHLAWFMTRALPELSDYPQGEYPFDESQAGEGFHTPVEAGSVLNLGGDPIPEVHCVYSFEEAYQVAEATGAQKCFIMGGASVYRAALPDMDRLYITHVHAAIPDADAFFPEINPAIWAVESTTELHTDPETGYRFEFTVYTRR